jgi:spore coat protein U-like protein
MLRTRLLAMGMVALSTTTAGAATSTGNVAVSMTITASCVVTNGSLAFGTGSITVLATFNIIGTGSFGVNCSSGAPYAITLGNGSNFSGGVRRMSNGSTGFLNYNLYTNSTRTNLWIGATSVSGTGTGANQTINVWGRVPGGVSVPSGAYTDTVQITVTY